MDDYYGWYTDEGGYEYSGCGPYNNHISIAEFRRGGGYGGGLYSWNETHTGRSKGDGHGAGPCGYSHIGTGFDSREDIILNYREDL